MRWCNLPLVHIIDWTVSLETRTQSSVTYPVQAVQVWSLSPPEMNCSQRPALIKGSTTRVVLLLIILFHCSQGSFTENFKSSWCQLGRYRGPVPPVATKLASWRLSKCANCRIFQTNYFVGGRIMQMRANHFLKIFTALLWYFSCEKYQIIFSCSSKL